LRPENSVKKKKGKKKSTEKQKEVFQEVSYRQKVDETGRHFAPIFQMAWQRPNWRKFVT